MNARTLAIAVGSAVTTFLLAGAATIELLSAQFGDGPGAGILGVAVGLLLGVAAVVAVVLVTDRLSSAGVTALVAYAAFGVAFLGIAALQYVNVPGADDLFTFPVHLAVSLVLALAVAALAGRRRVGRGAVSH